MQPTAWSSYKRQFFPGQSNLLRKSSSRDRISTDACKREKYFVLRNVDSKVDVTFLTKGNNSETARSPHFNTTKSYFLAPLMYVEQFYWLEPNWSFLFLHRRVGEREGGEGRERGGVAWQIIWGGDKSASDLGCKFSVFLEEIFLYLISTSSNVEHEAIVFWNKNSKSIHQAYLEQPLARAPISSLKLNIFLLGLKPQTSSCECFHTQRSPSGVIFSQIRKETFKVRARITQLCK